MARSGGSGQGELPYGRLWELECSSKGLDPLTATADDVLGAYTRFAMWDADGRLILSATNRIGEDSCWSADTGLTGEYYSVEDFMDGVQDVAGLTQDERMLVESIVDGGPIPGTGQYTITYARRFKRSPATIRKIWQRAKRKLLDRWAG